MGDDRRVAGINDEQILYAKILEIGMFVGLVLLLVTFALYLSGVVTPSVPVEELPTYWEMGVHEYVEATNHAYLHREQPVTGWSWLSLLRYGDYLNFLGVAVLSLVTIVCFLGIIPMLLKKRDHIYGLIAIAEVAVLMLAASGLLSIGH